MSICEHILNLLRVVGPWFDLLFKALLPENTLDTLNIVISHIKKFLETSEEKSSQKKWWKPRNFERIIWAWKSWSWTFSSFFNHSFRSTLRIIMILCALESSDLGQHLIYLQHWHSNHQKLSERILWQKGFSKSWKKNQ